MRESPGGRPKDQDQSLKRTTNMSEKEVKFSVEQSKRMLRESDDSRQTCLCTIGQGHRQVVLDKFYWPPRNTTGTA